MRSIALSGFGASPELRDDLPAPMQGENEVLVRVHASSVNPVDAAIASGMLQGMFEHEFPIVLGRDYDALLDAVSYTPDAVDAYAAALRPGGRVASSNGAAGEGAGRTNLMAVPTPENLERLAGLLSGGTLTIPIQRSYPLAQAGEALQALAAEHTQGKIAVSVAG